MSLSVAKLVKDLNFNVAVGVEDLERIITSSALKRPGVELTGFFDYHVPQRIQIFGKSEIAYLQSLQVTIQRERLGKLLSPETPCVFVAHSVPIPKVLREVAGRLQVPVVATDLSTIGLIVKLIKYLEHKLAPKTTYHGVLVDIAGIGTLLTGESGIGKSETALELIKRGHRLVADDMVEIRRTADDCLVGRAPEVSQHMIEIRGLGIINVKTLFGAGAVTEEERISLIIQLEEWQKDKNYDRLGLEEDSLTILGLPINNLILPVRPGRSLATIVEVAAMNHRLKQLGYHGAKDFLERLQK